MTTYEVAHPLFNDILDFLVSSPTPEQIIAYRPSDVLQSRLADLLDRNRQGVLTDAEQAELDEFSRMNHLMSMLKIRARKRIAAS